MLITAKGSKNNIIIDANSDPAEIIPRLKTATTDILYINYNPGETPQNIINILAQLPASFKTLNMEGVEIRDNNDYRRIFNATPASIETYVFGQVLARASAEDAVNVLQALPASVTTITGGIYWMWYEFFFDKTVQQLQQVFGAFPATYKHLKAYPVSFDNLDHAYQKQTLILNAMTRSLESIELLCREYTNSIPLLTTVVAATPNLIEKYTSLIVELPREGNIKEYIKLLQHLPALHNLKIIFERGIHPELNTLLQSLPANITDLQLEFSQTNRYFTHTNVASAISILDAVPNTVKNLDISKAFPIEPPASVMHKLLQHMLLRKNFNSKVLKIFNHSLKTLTSKNVIIPSKWFEFLSKAAPIGALLNTIETILNAEQHAATPFVGLIAPPNPLTYKDVLQYYDQLKTVNSALANITCGLLLSGQIISGYLDATYDRQANQYTGDFNLLNQAIDHYMRAAEQNYAWKPIIGHLINDIGIFNLNLPENISKKIHDSLDALGYTNQIPKRFEKHQEDARRKKNPS